MVAPLVDAICQCASEYAGWGRMRFDQTPRYASVFPEESVFCLCAGCVPSRVGSVGIQHRYFFWVLARGRQQSSGERLDRYAHADGGSTWHHRTGTEEVPW